ncbi:uncharacterized protein Z520_08293 [Fonsecaea multimorphosa CBS 102226]|uniref:Kinetochore protein mis13 n=1 Tax=Fonsecaea multimorphosa CBS 102226 TaxID=1442371 RepID=A0A0D2KHA4_9EURO|nr:uncharacterized protein Z520_08293 [Fonsecaea multimorphosa CBS 102226]KIX96038.1 hypothetical protein Z520_08293 [Fonsecaea multimorphosa CBS 102226]OAL21806.1 hypothetical protein AYO22_07748 [Fonsecaea multimorphosa]
MSSVQRPTRRLSARIQEKDDATLYSNREQSDRNVRTIAGTSDPVAAQAARPSNEKKRKMDYDEEDDGFQFKRVKKKPSQAKPTGKERDALSSRNNAPEPQPASDRPDISKNEEIGRKPTQRRNRTSFPTPSPKEDPPRRRSKRLSKDNEQQVGSPVKKSVRREEPTKSKHHAESPRKQSPEKKVDEPPPKEPEDNAKEETTSIVQQDHAPTKIALPFADTPVIKRNKAMREGKAGKGERRSSLGMRGRRASSLIESGNSSALPHPELDVSDYYKHIESEGLPEPRRMKQLLIWCAERALDEKPLGTGFGEASARQAARVIEEELLKELANRSDLSDWFGREEVPVPKEPLPERPNPKNTQNIEKIAELEEQIKCLRLEKEALEKLLRPPSVASLGELDVPTSPSKATQLDRSLLSEADAAALDILTPNAPTTTDHISQRLGGVLESIGPTVDTFADGIHRIAQYRTAADGVAGRALAICAEKLTQREKEGKRKALGMELGSPPRDLGGVLRSLSRADR